MGSDIIVVLCEGINMRINEGHFEMAELSSEKASELGKTLSKGGITRSDSETAFPKRCRR
ncbi:MAG: hypothetical protein KAS30_03145 [Candidatus Diapherotrites archaeon]|nr:hypothetical protein [Candidatus Diapherotrites archaeon]